MEIHTADDFESVFKEAAKARSAAMVLSQNKMIYQFGPDEKLLFWLGVISRADFSFAYPLLALSYVVALIPAR